MKNTNFSGSLQSPKKNCNLVISVTSNEIWTRTDCSDANYKEECKEPAWKCRYVVVLFGFFVLFFLNCYRLNVGVTLVAMVNNTALSEKTGFKSQSCVSLMSNITTEQDLKESLTDGEFIWSPEIQGYIQSSYFVGYIVMQIPTGVLVERYGFKWLFFSASSITAVCTLLIPPLSRISDWAFIEVNTVRGLAQGLIQPSMAVLVANWFPKTERGLLFTIIQSGSALGSFLGSTFSGLLCEYGGWPSSFYTIGCAGIVLSISIAVFIYENPNVHPTISKAERDFILNNQESVLSQMRPSAPWRRILTSAPVHATALACFGQLWALSQFLIVHATYLGTILHYPIGQNGFFSALPFLLQFITGQATAFVSNYLQKKKIASVDRLRRLCNLSSCVGYSACLLGIYIAGCTRNLSIIFGIMSMGFIGIGFGGCWITPTDMSPQFAGSLNALCLAFASLASVFLSLIVGYLTNNMQTIEQWNKVMFISVGVVLTSGIIFAIFGSADVQPWNFVEGSESKEVDGTKDVERKTEDEVTKF